jgi:hypothetical protein
MDLNAMWQAIQGLAARITNLEGVGVLPYTPPTAWTPTVTGLTTPVYAAQTGYYAQVGSIIYCWGRLDITSWAGQSGAIRINLPVSTIYTLAAGEVGYFRTGSSTQEGSKQAVITTGPCIYMMTNDQSNAVNWEASARVVLQWSIAYYV